jgi:hypothetical protein
MLLLDEPAVATSCSSPLDGRRPRVAGNITGLAAGRPVTPGVTNPDSYARTISCARSRADSFSSSLRSLSYYRAWLSSTLRK